MIEALLRPFTKPKQLFLMVFLNALPIVNLFSAGYALRCTQVKQELPAWEQPKKLFITGVIFAVLNILVAVILGYFYERKLLGITIALLFGASYTLPIALTAYSKEERINSLLTGLKQILNREYLKAWLKSAFAAIIWLVITLILLIPNILLFMGALQTPALLIPLIFLVAVYTPLVISLMTCAILITTFTLYGKAYEGL